MKKLMDKINKEGVFCSSVQFSMVSFEYVQNFWSTLIGSNFTKKHVELFFIITKLA